MRYKRGDELEAMGYRSAKLLPIAPCLSPFAFRLDSC